MAYDLGALVGSTRTVTIHAAVPRGRDPRSERETRSAIVLRPILAKDGERAGAFRAASTALQHVEHSGLLRVEELIDVEGRPAAVGVLPPGAPLSRLLCAPTGRARPFGAEPAARLVLDTARAVQVVHAARADLRPLGFLSSDSIWATTEGRALLLPSVRTAPLKPSLSIGHGGGWTRYRAPECEHGHADERADVYSLAILLWELLALGRPCAPSPGLEETSECPTWVDPSVMKLVMRSLSSEVSVRPSDAGAFAVELESLLHSATMPSNEPRDVPDDSEEPATIELERIEPLTVELASGAGPFTVAAPQVRSVRSIAAFRGGGNIDLTRPLVPPRPAPRRGPGAARLRVVGGTAADGHQLVLGGEGARWVVGRATFADFVVPDPDMSREHFEVLRVGKNGFQVHDLGSKNGLFVNGRAATHRLLVPGDEVFAGATRLRFEA